MASLRMIFHFYGLKNEIWKILYIHQDALVPAHACHEDGLEAIGHNLYDGGQRNRE